MKNKSLKGYLIAGVLVWLPLWATFTVIKFLVNTLDQTLALIPAKFQPAYLVGYEMPGFGVVVSLIIVFLTGILVTNYFGHRIIHFWERLVDKIPLVRSIYTAVKQVLESLFSDNSQSFRKVLLVEYPRKGIWTIALQAGSNIQEVNNKTGEDCAVVFVPTTPNPTSGFIMMIPKSDIKELDMSIDEAFKLIISLGVVQPNHQTEQIAINT